MESDKFRTNLGKPRTNTSRANFRTYAKNAGKMLLTYEYYSQYHDYVELFKSWFGDNVDQKIIESAIIFWFKDVDCKAENKVVEYLGEY